MEDSAGQNSHDVARQMNKSLSLVVFATLLLATPLYATPQGAGRSTRLDTHVHLTAFYQDGSGVTSDFAAAAANALNGMDQLGVTEALLMPTPFSPGAVNSPFGYDYTVLADLVEQTPDRFEFLGGGFLLNPMMHQIPTGQATQAQLAEFAAHAEAIAQSGAAGFGEITALHMSIFPGHPYLEIPPDHEFMLLLADIAAANDMPVDLHMEPVTEDMLLGSEWQAPNPQPPEVVHENVTAFKTLLDYNLNTRWVWTHAGTDHLGDMTVSLIRTLLGAHDNLYIAIKVTPGAGGNIVESNRPVDLNGVLRPEWLQLITDFSDRVMLGSDHFYGVPGHTSDSPPMMASTFALADQLPTALAQAVVEDNVRAVYRLGCAIDPVASFCGTSPNSVGVGALIGYTGSLSHASNDFTLRAEGCPSDKFGIFFYGQSQTQTPLGDGVRCVANPLFRLPVLVTDFGGVATWDVDLEAPLQPAGEIDPGSTWNFQLWYRDPDGPSGNGGNGHNLSNGLQVTFCP